MKFGFSRVLCDLKKICEFFIQNLYNLISTTENIDKFESYLRAKHTKDSKEFACSTLTLSHLSRAFLPINLRWVRGSLLLKTVRSSPELNFVVRNRNFLCTKILKMDRRRPAQTGADRRKPAQTGANRRKPAIFSTPDLWFFQIGKFQCLKPKWSQNESEESSDWTITTLVGLTMTQWIFYTNH